MAPYERLPQLGVAEVRFWQVEREGHLRVVPSLGELCVGILRRRAVE